MTNAQALKLLVSILIGLFLASLQSVLFSLPFGVLVIIAAIILILRLVGSADVVYVIVGIIVGALAAFLVPGMAVGADPFLLYLGMLWLVFKV